MKLGIISIADFQPIFMIKNYLESLYLMHRPFSYFDPDYDEFITILTPLKTITEAAVAVTAGLKGFEVQQMSSEDIVKTADKIIIFWNGDSRKTDVNEVRILEDVTIDIKKVIESSIKFKKNLEIYFSPKENKK